MQPGYTVPGCFHAPVLKLPVSIPADVERVVCFIALLSQFRLHQYTTTVYVSSKLPSPSVSLVARVTHSVQAVDLPVHKCCFLCLGWRLSGKAWR